MNATLKYCMQGTIYVIKVQLIHIHILMWDTDSQRAAAAWFTESILIDRIYDLVYNAWLLGHPVEWQYRWLQWIEFKQPVGNESEGLQSTDTWLCSVKEPYPSPILEPFHTYQRGAWSRQWALSTGHAPSWNPSPTAKHSAHSHKALLRFTF